MDSRQPKLWNLKKYHKDNAPISSTVSYIDISTHRQSTKVNKIFKEIHKLKPTYSIKSLLELTESLKSKKIQ